MTRNMRPRRPRRVAKRNDPILWSFIVFCAVGIALQTVLLLLGSASITLSDVEGALFALGAVVLSPAGLVLGLASLVALQRSDKRRRRRRSKPEERLRLR